MKNLISLLVTIIMLCSITSISLAAGVTYIDVDMTSLDAAAVPQDTIFQTATSSGLTGFSLGLGTLNEAYGSAAIVEGAGENGANALVFYGNSEDSGEETRVSLDLAHSDQGTALNNVKNGGSFRIKFKASELKEGAYARLRYVLNHKTTFKQSTRIDVYLYNDKLVINGVTPTVVDTEFYYPNNTEWHELVVFTDFSSTAKALQVFVDDVFVFAGDRNSNATTFRAVSVILDNNAKDSRFYIERAAAYNMGSKSSVADRITITTTNIKIADSNEEAVTTISPGATLTASGMAYTYSNGRINGIREYSQWAYSDTENGVYRPIPGANNSSSYTVSDEYSGKYIKYRYVVQEANKENTDHLALYGKTYESSPILVVPDDGLVYMPSSTLSDSSLLTLLEDGQNIVPSVTITNYGEAQPDAECRLFAAIYLNGKLESVKLSDAVYGLVEGENHISTDGISFTLSELDAGNIEDYTLKLFVWNSSEGLMPLWDGYSYHSTHKVK